MRVPSRTWRALRGTARPRVEQAKREGQRLEDSRKRRGIFHGPRVARLMARQIRAWRLEVANQWPTGRLEVDARALEWVLRHWRASRLEPRLLVYVVLWAASGCFVRACPLSRISRNSSWTSSYA